MWSLFWQSFDVHDGFIVDTSLFESFSMYFNIHTDKLSFSVLIWTCYMQMMKRSFHESVIKFKSLIHFISTQCTYLFWIVIKHVVCMKSKKLRMWENLFVVEL